MALTWPGSARPADQVECRHDEFGSSRRDQRVPTRTGDVRRGPAHLLSSEAGGTARRAADISFPHRAPGPTTD